MVAGTARHGFEPGIGRRACRHRKHRLELARGRLLEDLHEGTAVLRVGGDTQRSLECGPSQFPFQRRQSQGDPQSPPLETRRRAPVDQWPLTAGVVPQVFDSAEAIGPAADNQGWKRPPDVTAEKARAVPAVARRTKRKIESAFDNSRLQVPGNTIRNCTVVRSRSDEIGREPFQTPRLIRHSSNRRDRMGMDWC